MADPQKLLEVYTLAEILEALGMEEVDVLILLKEQGVLDDLDLLDVPEAL